MRKKKTKKQNKKRRRNLIEKYSPFNGINEGPYALY